MFEIVHDTFEVVMFAKSIMLLDAVENMHGIGLKKDGKLIAACIFEGYNGQNVWVHLAAVPTKRWMTRRYVRECFGYAFDALGVKRLSGYVNASNVDSSRICEHFGFKREATLIGAAYDGGDVHSYVMWREDCRFLGE
jgi:RimJ/RimL family protein N-acetyltransferase